MVDRIAIVFGGGGSRGAMQVGAIRALLERGIQPDLLVGSSVGAVNATHLAVHGFSEQGLAALEAAWQDAARSDLLPANYVWLSLKVLLNRADIHSNQRMRDFFLAHGITPELRFADLNGPELLIVATDLNAFQACLYGSDPEQCILEGLLASTALPPWGRPLELPGRSLADGGIVSNLPIEPAVAHGATEIFALDLSAPNEIDLEAQGFGSFYNKLIATIEERQIYLEKALAAARNRTVCHIRLRPENPLPIWDFSNTQALIQEGYQITSRYLETWQPRRASIFPKWAVTTFDRARQLNQVPSELEKLQRSRNGDHSARKGPSPLP